MYPANILLDFSFNFFAVVLSLISSAKWQSSSSQSKQQNELRIDLCAFYSITCSLLDVLAFTIIRCFTLFFRRWAFQFLETWISSSVEFFSLINGQMTACTVHIIRHAIIKTKIYIPWRDEQFLSLMIRLLILHKPFQIVSSSNQQYLSASAWMRVIGGVLLSHIWLFGMKQITTIYVWNAVNLPIKDVEGRKTTNIHIVVQGILKPTTYITYYIHGHAHAETESDENTFYLSFFEF